MLVLNYNDVPYSSGWLFDAIEVYPPSFYLGGGCVLFGLAIHFVFAYGIKCRREPRNHSYENNLECVVDPLVR